MLQINFACNIYHIIGLVIGSVVVPYFFGDLEELQQIHNSYIGGKFVDIGNIISVGCQIR